MELLLLSDLLEFLSYFKLFQMAAAPIGAVGMIPHILSDGGDPSSPACTGGVFDVERQSSANSSYENEGASLISELTTAKEKGRSFSELKSYQPSSESSSNDDNRIVHEGK